MESRQRPFVGIGVLVWRGDQILLGKRRGAHGSGEWAPPGGYLEAGETPLACGERELWEETGLTGKRWEIGPILPHTSEGQAYLTIFVHAYEVAGEPELKEANKCEGWQWFDTSALPRPLFAPFAGISQELTQCARQKP